MASDFSQVVFSLPGNDFFETIIPELKGSASFVWRGFENESPLNRIVGKRKYFDLDQPLEIPLEEMPFREDVSQNEYELLVKKAIDFSGQFHGKVVLSRNAHKSIKAFSINDTLKRLKASFPNALVYLLATENDGVWMGATPETLVKQTASGFETMALAGTKWNNEAFEEKEFFEQELVVKSIAEKLGEEEVTVGERISHQFGAINHLKTPITWLGNKSVDQYAQLLHPTPAICGFPQMEAYDFILKTENYKRSLYTGYLGLVDANENSHLFVNLRCMQLFRNHILLYAGGGINEMSVPQTEWEETIRKMNTVLSAMKIND